jgi:hypothetical protein
MVKFIKYILLLISISFFCFATGLQIGAAKGYQHGFNDGVGQVVTLNKWKGINGKSNSPDKLRK